MAIRSGRTGFATRHLGPRARRNRQGQDRRDQATRFCGRFFGKPMETRDLLLAEQGDLIRDRVLQLAHHLFRGDDWTIKGPKAVHKAGDPVEAQIFVKGREVGLLKRAPIDRDPFRVERTCQSLLRGPCQPESDETPHAVGV